MWVVGFLIQLQTKHYIPDNALNMLLKFFYTLFRIRGQFSGFVSGIVAHFPSSLHRLKKSLPHSHQFTRFVVCPKCWKIYHYGECVVISGSQISSQRCKHIQYPDHPYQSRRKECGHLLLKSVSMISGQKILHPHKVYCYKSLQSSLRELLLHPSFHRYCQ